MTDVSSEAREGAPWYWAQFEAGRAKAGQIPPGADIAVFTQGLTKPAGTVPALWRFHRTRLPDHLAARGVVTDDLVAEHMALALFGAHQQSVGVLMHRPGVRLGAAARALHERYSEDGVDRVMESAARAQTLPGVFLRVRALVSMLAAAREPLDYTSLLHDLRAWPDPERRARVIRGWGFTYRPWVTAGEPAGAKG
ncbi:type I-E CRISPR-associated protein Cse2/CasB [Streptomyces sp. NPDC059447]|uniref:type I-E CRISPR-associated protein Cse2/CasB n=1 Tax=Streptomyces sp. NPDC059447 TaxID=3346834 RepID=UPI0036890705